MSQSSLIDIFFVESEELLGELEAGLMGLDASPTDMDLINRIFRAAHTIKGNAGMVGFDAIVEFAHAMEGVLDAMRDQSLTADRDLIGDLLRSRDVLKGMIERAAAGTDPRSGLPVEELRTSLKSRLERQPKAQEPSREQRLEASRVTSQVFEIVIKLKPEIFETGQDPFMLLEDLATVGTILDAKVDTSALPEFEKLEVYRLYLSWTVIVRTEAGRAAIDAVFLFVASENDIKITEVSDKQALTKADKPLGQLLVERGVVSPSELDQALAQQSKLGDILVSSGKVKRSAVEKIVAEQQAARNARRTSSIRVDTEKLDKLVNLVGELVIACAQSGASARSEAATMDARRAAAEGLERITRELQEQVLTVRMVPVEETFLRFKRVVRDLADELGKKVVLETSGTETELDKTMIEKLVDPLKHMVRNCVDHGMETPAERIAAGKSEEGHVWLRAQQREGRIVIEVADDGRGINRDKVIAKALSVGLIETGENMTERQVYDLLFQPGFSTSPTVTEISGRGVGMDVVRRNVEELNGTIEVESTLGRGTTFRIALPLTLAIIDGMSVKVGEEKLTFPLLSVVELIYPKKEDIETIENKTEIVQVRGEYLPMIRLYRLFGLETLKTNPTEAMIMVIDNDGRRFGVMVDDVLGMEQAVVKSLDSTFNLFNRLGNRDAKRPDGIAGATIMGDGSVSMIVDVYGIERMAFGAMA